MKRTFLALSAFLAAFAAAAADQESIRLDITSKPEKASVSIDGEPRGLTPLTLLDVKPGEKRLVTVSLKGYKTFDEFLSLQNGAYVQRHYDLSPERGLLLVRTDPPGCDVSYDGISRGVTPLLLTELAVGQSYQLTLSQTGYGKKTVKVNIDGRRPKIVDETLTLDSGILDIVSDPVGAEVIVDGVSRGTAPVKVERVKGSVKVVLKKDGYEVLNREVKMSPGEHQTLSVRLKGLPTRLTVVSIPEKARVYIDDQYQGRSPVNVSVEGGSHRVRAELPGYAPLSRTVNIPNRDTVTEEFRLKSMFGRLEITSTPVGVEVWVDKKKRGTTKNTRDGAQTSQPFAVEELMEGEHQVTLKMKGYEEASKHFEVSPNRTTELRVKLKRIFTPDIEITTINGTVKRGQLLEQTAVGSFRIETRPGLEEVISADDVKSVKPIE